MAQQYGWTPESQSELNPNIRNSNLPRSYWTQAQYQEQNDYTNQLRQYRASLTSEQNAAAVAAQNAGQRMVSYTNPDGSTGVRPYSARYDANANAGSGWTPDTSGFQQRFQSAQSNEPYSIWARPEAEAAYQRYLSNLSDPTVYQGMRAQSPEQLTNSAWDYISGGVGHDPSVLAAQTAWEQANPAAAEYNRFNSGVTSGRQYGALNWVRLGDGMPSTDEWGGMFYNPNRPSFPGGYNLGMQSSWDTSGLDAQLARLRSAADAEAAASAIPQGGRNEAAP
jgi:hypothetical protein